MMKVLAVANQKGGVAKTTTVHSLGVALAEMGRKVLLVDLDPQACLTYSLGINPDTLESSLHDVLVGRVKIQDVTEETGKFWTVPANIDLAGSEVHLLSKTGREHTLSHALADIRLNYDVALIDCPPSLGVLTINGLTAANEVIIPLTCEALSYRGMSQLLETIEDVKAFTNPRLKIRGAIVTMYDDRTRHAKEVLDEVRRRHGVGLLEPPVRKSIRFAEAPTLGKSILEHAPSSKGAKAYRQLAVTLNKDLR